MSLFHFVQSDSQPASYSLDTWGSLCGGKATGARSLLLTSMWWRS